MPGLDKTDPRGEDPETSRGLGPCGSGLVWRQGRGMGRGLGRCFGWNSPQKRYNRKLWI